MHRAVAGTVLSLAMLSSTSTAAQQQRGKRARPTASDTRPSMTAIQAGTSDSGSSYIIDRTEVILVALGGIAIVLILLSQTIAARRRARELEQSFGQRIKDWIGGERARIVIEQSDIAKREATVQLEDWKRREEQTIRQDAVARSHSVIVGKVTEHLVPFLPDFSWNPKDARFIGAPVDLIVFDGLDDGELRQILFVEVKTGSAVLTAREKQIRDAIDGRRIGWREIRIGSPVPPSLPASQSTPQLPAAPSFVRRFFK